MYYFYFYTNHYFPALFPTIYTFLPAIAIMVKITSMIKLEIGREYTNLAGKNVLILYGVLLLCWIFFKVTVFSLTLIYLDLLPREHCLQRHLPFLLKSHLNQKAFLLTHGTLLPLLRQQNMEWSIQCFCFFAVLP